VITSLAGFEIAFGFSLSRKVLGVGVEVALGDHRDGRFAAPKSVITRVENRGIYAGLPD
jgi:hypothetical protein